MNIYHNNIECMKIHNSKLYELLENLDIETTSNHLEEISSISTMNGSLALTVKKDGLEHRLNSIYNPFNEAEIWVKQFSFKNLANIISLFGLGNGVFAKAIADNMGQQDKLLIYEPSCEIFVHVLNHYDITDILKNRQIILAIEDLNAFHFHLGLISFMNIGNLRNQIVCMHPKYEVVFGESSIWFWNEVKDSYAHTKINVNTLMYFGERIIENTIKNIHYITNTNTLSELRKVIPKDMPAIIVAAGPSVRKEIENLKLAKGKAVIFAVDRILDYLLEEGVEPDFVTTVDPKKPLQYFSKRDDIKIPLICFMESNHELLEFHKGRKIICNSTDYLSRIYIKNNIVPPILPSGASVATMTFSACKSLGFSKIMLVGQDLAYDGDLSHAGGINEADLTGRDTMIEGIDGEMIRSRLDWKEFAMWFGDMIEIYPQITVIDAKMKGAKIKGAINISLKDALDEYCKIDENYIINIENLQPTFTNDVYKDIKEYFQESIDSLNIIKSKSKNAIKICDLLKKEAQKNIATNKSKDYNRKLNNVIKYIESQPVYKLIDLYIHAISAQNISEMYNFTEDSREDNITTYIKSKQIFETVLKSIEFIEPKLEKAVEFCDNNILTNGVI